MNELISYHCPRCNNIYSASKDWNEGICPDCKGTPVHPADKTCQAMYDQEWRSDATGTP